MSVLGVFLVLLAFLYFGRNLLGSKGRHAGSTSKEQVTPAGPPPGAVAVELSSRGVVKVVGESYHREALERIAGGMTPDGCKLTEVAMLVAEPTNPYDPNAIAVYIRGLMVGHLSLYDAAVFKPIVDGLLREGKIGTCPAFIRGGWYRSESDWGDFGVTLKLAMPEEVIMRPYSGPGAYKERHHSEWQERVAELKRTDSTAAETLLRGLLDAVEEEARVKSQHPSPLYYEQLGIVLRKQKRHAEEVAVLERFTKVCGPENQLAGRLEKARTLAAKESSRKGKK